MNHKLTIFFVVEWFFPVIGGAGTQALEQAKTLQDDFNIIFVTRAIKGSKKIDEIEGFPVYRFGSGTNGRRDDYQSGIELYTFLSKKRKEIDIIHIHGNIENNFAIASILFAQKNHIAVIAKLAIAGELKMHLESEQYSVYQKLFKNLNPLNQFRRQKAKELDHYLAISNDIFEEIHQAGISKEKITFIPNGVNTNYFKPPTSEEKRKKRTELQIPSSTTVFLVVSRLARHKGIIHPLLEMWKKHFGDDRSKLLMIVGDDEGLSSSNKADVSQYLKTNRLSNVRLEGRKTDIIPYYQASDIFILPSENEGLSNALLEAAASGLICIVSKVSGNTDVITEGTTGYLFQKGDAENLFKTIDESLQNKDRWAKMSSLVRETIVKEYSIEQTSIKIKQIYKIYENR